VLTEIEETLLISTSPVSFVTDPALCFGMCERKGGPSIGP
jgi:hypothetical protein